MGMEWGGGWDLQSLTWATQLELALFEVNLDCHTRPLSFTPLPGEGRGNVPLCPYFPYADSPGS